MKSAAQMKLNPPFRRQPDFIPEGDFIIEDDLFHPTGWI
jgi:hypothetical protein